MFTEARQEEAVDRWSCVLPQPLREEELESEPDPDIVIIA